MMDTYTGDVRILTRDDFIDGNLPTPGPHEVLVQGHDEQIERLSRAVKALGADDRRKAKRKSQRASRKANR